MAKKGGEKVAKERCPQFYREIGRKGGEKVAEERGSEFYAVASVSRSREFPPRSAAVTAAQVDAHLV